MENLIGFLKYLFKIKSDNELTEEEKKEIMKLYEKFKQKHKNENKENYIMVNRIK